MVDTVTLEHVLSQFLHVTALHRNNTLTYFICFPGLGSCPGSPSWLRWLSGLQAIPWLQLQLQQKALYKCQTIPFSVHLFGLQSELIHCKKCLKKKKRKTRKGKGGGREEKENSYRTLILSDNYHLSLLLLLHHVCGWSDEWATWTWFKCWQEEVANTCQIK